MTVKFRVGFTIDGQTLFAMMSKFLPIENLIVEEMIEQPRPDPAIRFDKKFDLKPIPSGAMKILAAAKKKPKHNRKSPGPDLTRGINAIIINLLRDGKTHKAQELRPMLKAQGYSDSSVSSRIEELRKHGVVKHMGSGTWKLIDRFLPPTDTTGGGEK
jgi:predicted HTH transcriptional regulator